MATLFAICALTSMISGFVFVKSEDGSENKRMAKIVMISSLVFAFFFMLFVVGS